MHSIEVLSRTQRIIVQPKDTELISRIQRIVVESKSNGVFFKTQRVTIEASQPVVKVISNIQKIVMGGGVKGKDGADSIVPGPQGPQGEIGPQGPQGDVGPAGNVGPEGLTWRGNWEAGTNYVIDDGVGHEGASYIAIVNNVGSEPPSSDWAVLSSQGDVGPAGPMGPQGLTGAQGPNNLIIELTEEAAIAAAAAAGVTEYVWVDEGSDPPLLWLVQP